MPASAERLVQIYIAFSRDLRTEPVVSRHTKNDDLHVMNTYWIITAHFILEQKF